MKVLAYIEITGDLEECATNEEVENIVHTVVNEGAEMSCLYADVRILDVIER